MLIILSVITSIVALFLFYLAGKNLSEKAARQAELEWLQKNRDILKILSDNMNKLEEENKTIRTKVHDIINLYDIKNIPPDSKEYEPQLNDVLNKINEIGDKLLQFDQISKKNLEDIKTISPKDLFNRLTEEKNQCQKMIRDVSTEYRIIYEILSSIENSLKNKEEISK